jgi:SAM-dependent methyltransferase
MRTPLSPGNPLGHNRSGFAWEHVPSGGAHLDFGCYDGAFLRTLTLKSPRRLVGVDASSEAIERARRLAPDIDFIRVAPDSPLPFANGEFDSVSLLDVLEHVADQPALLGELRRVLRPEGRLIVTVPGRHVFSVMDLGNLKFRFPRLHHRFYRLRHTEDEYRRRYVENPDGLIGDISAGKRWHEHFSRRRLTQLLGQNGFRVLEFDGTGLLMRPMAPLRIALRGIAPLERVLLRVTAWDARCFDSANLFCVATP